MSGVVEIGRVPEIVKELPKDEDRKESKKLFWKGLALNGEL
jgi:hypothetical protein